MSESICFTGHRTIPTESGELEQQLNTLIEKMICNHKVTKFYAGGAYGFDALASKAILKLREKYPQITLHLVLPCSNEEQTADWKDAQKREFEYILGFANSAEYISDHKTKSCMKDRNARLVDLASVGCICYWNPNDRRSGTGQTVRMAQRKGIEVINLFKGV